MNGRIGRQREGDGKVHSGIEGGRGRHHGPGIKRSPADQQSGGCAILGEGWAWKLGPVQTRRKLTKTGGNLSANGGGTNHLHYKNLGGRDPLALGPIKGEKQGSDRSKGPKIKMSAGTFFWWGENGGGQNEVECLILGLRKGGLRK